MAYSTPRTWVAGAVLTAAQLNQDIRDNELATFPLGVGAWTAYTPTVKLGATTVTIVNDSRYYRIGRLIVVELAFRFSNLNAGTGTLTITRPVAGRVNDAAVRQTYGITHGVATLFDASSGAVYKLTLGGSATDQSDWACHTIAQPGATVSNTVPLTIVAGALNTGDEFWGRATYEAVS